MRTIIAFLLLTTLTFGQLIVDSTSVEKVSDSEDWFWGRVYYEGVIPTLNDYTLGFLYSEYRDNLIFVPAGWFNHNASAKTITYRTEMGNLPEEKMWVQAHVIPISNVSKYKIGGVTYHSQGKDWYYDVFQEPYLESDLPRRTNGTAGEPVTFTIYATGQSLQYECFRRTMNIDSTMNQDSTYSYQYSWDDPVKINGQTSNEYTTPNLQLTWDGWKVFCRVYNALGEEYSRQTLLRVYEDD